MVQLEVPSEYGYVIFGQIVAGITLQVLGGEVMKARKKYNVQYPDMYSATSKEFNNVQRGHQNALETYSTFIFFNAVGGLKHPLLAAGFAVAWSIGRYLYQQGYMEGANKRYSKGGHLHWLGLLGSMGLSISLALSLLHFI